MKFESQYSSIDKLLHRISFATAGGQVDIAGLEDRLFSSELEKYSPQRPVFVTALPRAGTTVLLNLLAETGEFATHIYRDMPFVLCPLLWQRFSRTFHTKAGAMERAHEDGLQVSVESPEALEEIVWMPFWKKHYLSDKVEPWKSCDTKTFRDFFLSHMRKIVSLRSDSPASSRRYASKNNMNIARLRAIPAMLEDSTLIVLFRHPLQQAASLLNQHRRFLEMHREDSFSRRYMAGTGHFDFGANLRPINFDRWLQNRRCDNPLQLAFWLEYWIAAYRHALDHAGGAIHLLSFETLTAQPRRSLDRLSDVLALENADSLLRQSDTLRPSREHDIDTSALPAGLADTAEALHARLVECAVVPAGPAGAR